MNRALSGISVLTFDIFGTVLDLEGSLVPALGTFLKKTGADISSAAFWSDWRQRQRLEQHQDTILMLGHHGYLDSARRALAHTLRRHAVEYRQDGVDELLQTFFRLRPFPEVEEGLSRLADRYRLVALSNGDQHLLDHLLGSSIKAEFYRTFSVDSLGRFKPHPSVYRTAAANLACEPGEILMVAAHAFDVLGARACGYRGAYVNRYGLPYEDSSLRPDLEVADFAELADRLLVG